MLTGHSFYVLHYECAKCRTLYDVVWDPRREQEPPSQCPQCASPVRRFVGSSYRARPETRPGAVAGNRGNWERRTA
jgi:DNA-directed RNA polymerase subunit RPC12/RpoP